MNTEVVKDWLMKRIEEGEKTDMPLSMKSYLESHPEVAMDLQEQLKMWEMLGTISTPMPSSNLAVSFEQMLERETRKEANSMGRYLSNWWNQISLNSISTQQLAFGCLVALFGFFIGHSSNSKDQQQMTQLTEEVQQMREMMMLTLIEQPSVGKRLQAVSMTQELQEVDQKVIEALFETLNNDPNVNVRLVTVEALLSFSNRSEVREGMIESISKQQSPMVQLALAEAMILLKETRSVPELKALIESDTVEVEIKERISDLMQVLM